MIYTTHYKSPLGDILLAERNDVLIGLWIKDQKYFKDSVKEELVQKDTAILKKTKKWLDNYFAGNKPKISELNLAPEGSDFRKLVWDELVKIPYGETTTYGDIAKKVAKKMGKNKMSSQAVGGAVGHNPISIIIPCHRVVGSGGNLTGYAGGLDKKIKLLKLEGIDMSLYHRPN